MSASPDGSRIYVGGAFTTADGQTRSRIAAYSTSTGQLISTFAPSFNASVYSIVATNSTVYVGGVFSTVNGVARSRLAAINAANGALTGWAPTADYDVNALAMSTDGLKIYAAGGFTNLNGSPVYGVGALDGTTGASLPFPVNNLVQAYGTKAAFLTLSTDNTGVYGTAFNYGGSGNFEGTFAVDQNTGATRWIEDCHGDTYGSYSANGIVYTISHAHYCQTLKGWPVYNPWQMRHTVAFTANSTGTLAHNTQGGYADFYGQPAPSIIDWFPDFQVGTYTGASQASWSITGTSRYIVEGGEFPSVNGVKQQGLVRFAVPSIAPKKQAPMLSGSSFTPTLVPLSSTSVRVSWPANWDRDDQSLTYNVYRNGNLTTPVYTIKADSQWWNTPNMGFIDTGLTPGQTYSYRLQATDGDGNFVRGDTKTVTVSAGGTQTAYDKKVLADGASTYWPMGESSGSTLFDNAGFNDAVAGSGITRGTAGPVSGTTATTFDGTSNGTASTQTPVAGPNTFTTSTWVNTTSTSGGKILGFGDATSGTSSSYDRHLYLDTAGHVIFGVYNNTVSTLQSPTTVNDGKWHQIVASLGADGMTLYIDGIRVAHRSDVTWGQDYSGYWRVGGDNLGSWTNQPSSNFLSGSIGDTAIFPTVLSKQTVQDEYTASGRTLNVPSAPTDKYGKAVYADSPDLYWRLDEANGPTGQDTSGNQNTGTYAGSETFQTQSDVTGANGTGVTFDGSSGTVASSQQVSNPTTYSEEAWFKTTSTNGGKIIGFGDQQSGTSGSYDRHVFMNGSGQLTFGTWTGQENEINTSASYNDGKWHQVVATQGSDGMKLYVDGALAGTNPQTQAQAYNGYWRIGGDNAWDGVQPWFAGSIDEVAVYSNVLSADQVKAHYQASAVAPVAPNQAPTAAFTSSAADLKASFDGSGSADADGSVASYSWDFGDNSAAGSGVSPAHTYAAAGTYTVKLTVTDDKGATDSVSHSVTVTAPNQAPTAAFTSSAADLKASFDGSGSADADGSVASYSWDFGDNSAAGSGVSPAHTYAAAGTYTVKLTVTDDKGATDSVSHSVTVTAPNQAPTAAFTSSAADLKASFDGSGSADADGSVASYSWDFGDNSAAGSGVSPAHTYAAAGTYTVKLTVTDDKGATGSVTHTVTVTTPAQPSVYANDGFGRTSTGKWGTADTGGVWTHTSTSTFSVNGSAGLAKLTAAGNSTSAMLNSTSAQDVTETADISSDVQGSGTGTYVTVVARRIGTSDYRLKERLMTGGVVHLVISKVVNGTETTIKEVNVSALVYTPGDALRMRFTVTGSGTTTLAGKIWKVGTTEPASAQISATDTTAALQSPGNVGMLFYLSATSNSPVTISVDNFSAAKPA